MDAGPVETGKRLQSLVQVSVGQLRLPNDRLQVLKRQVHAVVASFREAGVEPHGPAPEAYAAVEVWGQAVRRAGTTAPAAVAEALRSHHFQAVKGEVGFDTKGDMVGPATWVWYGWRDGMYLPLEDLEPVVR